MSSDSARQPRRLSTILAADVVGYSRIMAEDEEGAVRMLKARRAIVDDLIERHHGRIFNTAGDSVVAEFGSAVEAVRCAITVQDDLRVQNAELPQEQQMQFRIGINVGDVLVDGDDLLGDGVNVAARLEGLADPGGVCISGSVFELVKNKLSYGFEDLGPQSVKNIPEPISAFRLRGGMAPTVETAMEATSGAKPSPSRHAPLYIALAVTGLVATGGAAGYWFYTDGKTATGFTPAPSPDRDATPSPAGGLAGKVAAGMTVRGISRVTHRPFRMNLGIGGAASVVVELPSGGQVQDAGKWWTQNGASLCIQFTRFAAGNILCRRLANKGGVIHAIAGDGKDDGWIID